MSKIRNVFIKQQQRGRWRYHWGLIWDLLEVEQRIGMKLTESYAMWPAASVCGWYFTHPASNYFTLGRIDEDQAQDYAKRKGWDEREMMKWLGVAMK